MKNKSRRSFLIKSSKIATAIIGTTIFGRYFLFSKTEPTIQYQESHYGKPSENGQKILVTYESKFGSTAEVADAIGKELSLKGNIVDVKKIKNVSNLNTYDRIVIGSAIQYDKWMPEAIDFVKSNHKFLSQIPATFFLVCLVLSKKTKKAEKKALGYAEKLYDLALDVQPTSVGRFAGVLDYSKMSFGGRSMAKILFAILGIKEGDYRDWDAIRSWARKC